MLRLSRRLALLGAIVVLAGGTLIWFQSSAPTPPKSPEAPPRTCLNGETGATRPIVAPGGAGERWGGALNSARADGAGFFDRQAGLRFSAACAPELRQYVVELNSRALLPESGAGAAEFLRGLENNRAPRTVYVQFLDNPTEAQRAEVAQAGVELLAYVSAYAWTARGTGAAFQTVNRLPFVRGFAAIDPRDKLQPAVYFCPTPPYALAPDGRTRYRLLAAPGTTADELGAQLGQAPALADVRARPVDVSVLGPRFELVAAPAQAREIAALDAVAYLRFASPPAASRDATTDLESNIGAVRDSGDQLDGSGITVAVREVGKPILHEDFASRTQMIDNDGATGQDADHATAVLGQVGSNGHVQPAAKGVAPGVQMLVYALSSPDDDFSTHDILDAGFRGVRISNHSYGPVQQAGDTHYWGDYEDDSGIWDEALRDNNLLGVFAGNELMPGLDPHQYKHIDYFVGAKNTLCVSATDTTARAGNATVPAADGIAYFTEFGPMNDGRIKPELVALGANVTLDLGTSDTQTPTGGTSFAAPVVTGVAALVFQRYKAILGREPTAALTKAILCNSATDLGVKGPDPIYGFGILNAQEAIREVDLATAGTETPFFEGTLSSGAQQEFPVNVPQGLAQLKVTLCWLDKAGNPTALKALVNDLDLVLVAPNNDRHCFPYSLNPSDPQAAATNAGANRNDTVEQVVVDNPEDGTWTLRVIGFNVPAGPQSFAVCANVTGIRVVQAVISSSPNEGPVPLTVSFLGNLSSGGPTTFTWDFGDGTTGTGSNVQHTYSQAGTYMAQLTVDDGQGNTNSVTTEIIVQKRALTAYPLQFNAALIFRRLYASALNFTMISHDPDLTMTPRQARQAVHNGTFEGKHYRVSGGLTPDASAELYEFIINKRGADASYFQTLRINLVKGTLAVKIKSSPDHPLVPLTPGDNAFFTALGIDDTTITLKPTIRIQIETDDVIYSADFPVTYRKKGHSGTLRKRAR